MPQHLLLLEGYNFFVQLRCRQSQPTITENKSSSGCTTTRGSKHGGGCALGHDNGACGEGVRRCTTGSTSRAGTSIPSIRSLGIWNLDVISFEPNQVADAGNMAIPNSSTLSTKLSPMHFSVVPTKLINEQLAGYSPEPPAPYSLCAGLLLLASIWESTAYPSMTQHNMA